MDVQSIMSGSLDDRNICCPGLPCCSQHGAATSPWCKATSVTASAARGSPSSRVGAVASPVSSVDGSVARALRLRGPMT
jgi:hypothetical protein